jgi:hypothetical protein
VFDEVPSNNPLVEAPIQVKAVAVAVIVVTIKSAAAAAIVIAVAITVINNDPRRWIVMKVRGVVDRDRVPQEALLEVRVSAARGDVILLRNWPNVPVA